MVRKMTERHHRPHRLHSQGFQSSLLVGQDRRIRGEKGFCVCAMCYTCAMASELCNVCCTVLVCVCVFQCKCVAHTEFALRWLPAGSLSADAHLHRDLAEGMGEHRQTCTHKQTDEYARAKHGEAFREAHKDEQRCPQPGIRDFVLILISINPII